MQMSSFWSSGARLSCSQRRRTHRRTGTRGWPVTARFRAKVVEDCTLGFKFREESS